MPPSQSYKRRRVAWQRFPDDQTLRLQTGAGEDDVIHLPSGLNRVDCERQDEEEAEFTRQESNQTLLASQPRHNTIDTKGQGVLNIRCFVFCLLILNLVVMGFLWVLRFPPLLHRLMVSASKNKTKINAISTLSNLKAVLSLRTTWQTTCCT